MWDRLQECQGAGYLLTEGESRHIGRLVVPPRFHAAMQEEVSLWVDADLDYRVKVILDDYPARDDLTAAFEPPLKALKERLGKEAISELLDLLHGREWQELTRRLMVDYYDPLYMHTCPERSLKIKVDSLEQGVAELKNSIQKLLHG